jgi:hypothetical protein
VVTTRDELVPAADQWWQAAQLGATVHEIAGNHTVCVGDPARFVPALVAACTEVAERAQGRRPPTGG